MKYFIILPIILLLSACTTFYKEFAVKVIFLEQYPTKKIILAYEIDYDLNEKNDLLIEEITNFCGESGYSIALDNVFPDTDIAFNKISGIGSFENYLSDIKTSYKKFTDKNYNKIMAVPLRIVAVSCNDKNLNNKVQDYTPLLEKEYLENKEKSRKNALELKKAKANRE